MHLVRVWMDEEGIARRPAAGQVGRRRRPMPRRKPAPPEEELRRLRLQEGWTLRELAAEFGVHPQTVRRWLAEADIARIHAPGALRGISVAELVERYGTGTMTAVELARTTDVPYERVLRELHAVGVMEPHRRPPAVSAEQGSEMVRLYLEEGQRLERIAEDVGSSVYLVRRHLRSAGVTIAPRSGIVRGDRQEAPPADVERLYVREGHSAERTGHALDIGHGVVLRTGHEHGLPIRPGGERPIVPTEIRLIEALYADDEVRAVLERHGVPQRPPIGGIALRFPEAVPLTPELVADLYVSAGCSTPQIELLTGQARVIVEDRMREWGIPVRRPRGPSPMLSRYRRARRLEWLEQVVELYERTRSTAVVAETFGCSQTTVQRWLAEAGVTVPGRGRWERSRPRRGDE